MQADARSGITSPHLTKDSEAHCICGCLCVLPLGDVSPANRSSETARVDGPYHVLRWFALRCPTRSEFTAMAALCTLGVFAFAPAHYRETRVGRRRRPRAVRSALMPGYVLAKLPHGHAARGVPLVRGVVSFAGEPAALPEVDVLD